MDEGLLRLEGAQEPQPDKWTSLCTVRFVGGWQSQRSAFASIAVSRYDAKFLGAKPDALDNGLNVEISNRLTMQRRPGLLAYGISNVPPVNYFYDWNLATTSDIILVLDTATGGGDNSVGDYGGVLNYSPTSSGIYVNKSLGSQQTSFFDVVNTLYLGDGVDLYKITGPNLLSQCNNFGSGASAQAPWTASNVTSFTTGQTDPMGGNTATQVQFSATGETAYVNQLVFPNYTPIADNTFTVSLWMKSASNQTITLVLGDQNSPVNNQAFTLTTSWEKYQVTGTMRSNSNTIQFVIQNPTTSNPFDVYGAQLEVGGPATTTEITTTKPQGVWLWGITAPTVAPTFTTTPAVGNTGLPWQSSHAYNVGDTIVDSNGNIQYATNNGVYPQLNLALTSVASGTGVYQGTVTGGANNGFVGSIAVISGFTNGANNGTFKITASTATQITTTNSSSTIETNNAQASLGVVGTAAGTSGAIQPTWNDALGGFTSDGLNSLIVQTISTSTPSTGSTASVTFPNPTTAGNTIVTYIFVSHPSGTPSVTDTQSDSFGSVGVVAVSGQFDLYCYYVNSIAGGSSTTVSVSNGGSNTTYLCAVEMAASVGSLDVANKNASQGSGGPSFTTGGVSTTNAKDVIFTIAAFTVAASAGASAEIGTPPSNYTTVNVDGPVAVASNSAFTNITSAILSVVSKGFYDPGFTIASPTTKSQNLGITAAFTLSAATLEWINLGPNGAGLTAATGYQWYYSYGNSYTGHFSNVSPISTTTGPITGQDAYVTGNTRTMTTSGGYSDDPQSDLIAVYRNTDGGGFWYQVALIGNGSAAQAALVAANYPGLTTSGVSYSGNTWTVEDTTSDSAINTSIFAPIGLLNSPPPAGLTNLEYFAGRLWGSVNGFLYYNTSADNASLLNVQQNGVPAESWVPTNYVPFNSGIVRSVATGGGLLAFTVTDTWFVTGQNLLTGGFNPQKAFAGHGLRSYNALSIDGSSLYFYTSDRQLLLINPNSGSVEIGYAIGDYLQTNFLPEDVYLARHISGSEDNAVFIADGSANWIRLNPNQQGASLSGEQTPVFSPIANFSSTIGGIGAIASIETSAGVHQLLVSQTAVGPILVRDINTYSDLGNLYGWNAIVGSILLTTPGKIAEAAAIIVEMNANQQTATPCNVFVLLNEIGSFDSDFEQLPMAVNDPPELAPSQTVLSNRYYLAQSAGVPMCRHLQIKLTGTGVKSVDEILALTIMGAIEADQS